MVPNKTIHEIPSKGFRGISNHWQNDLIAAFSVSLVALPLGLGVAMASGVPPMSGVISAIIGGLVTTLFRGSHIAINGPAAGLIAVMLAGLSSLNDGSGNTLNYLLAAIFISGLLQIVLGLLKLGKYAEVIPTSVIHGILAAIGIIIFSKQVHIALGTDSDAPTIIGVLLDIPQSILN
ncbi:MAG: SulP family inorganic anion transporter, partial [Bacteroidota bacterium]